MPITVNVAIAPGIGSNVATISAADVTVGSGSDRYALALVGEREFGPPADETAVTLEAEALSQLGTDQTWFSGNGLATLWGRVAPGSGASRTLTADFAASVLAPGIAGIVYDGVDQTTPTRDVDQNEASGTAVTSTTSASLTLTTESGDRVVMCIVIRVDNGGAVTTSGETERVNGNASGVINWIIVDKTASGTSTTINPTLSFGSSDYQMAFFAVALRESGGGGGAQNVLAWIRG
jgi:hypothetical protein